MKLHLSGGARTRVERRLILPLRVLTLVAVVGECSAGSALALTRHIFDCGDPVGDTSCYMDFVQDGYFYGRSEGQPPRGPNPLGPLYSGSIDVDLLYDLTGQIDQYYQTRLNRNGPNARGGTGNGTTVSYDVYRMFANGNGSSIGAVLCDVPAGTPSAAATATSCVFCRGSATPDTVGHEVGHIMARNMRQPASSISLGSTNEAGALNEAMGDFFGEAFERFLTGSNDWILGTGHSLPVRSLSDPPSVPQGPYASPDRYLSPDFYTGTDDAGGVHINAGVINKGAYLASEGGVFNGYTIAGIGFDKVEQIWYRALTQYFVPSETFNLAYDHFLQATADLYGPYEMNQMTLALQAVEINQIRNVPEPGCLALTVCTLSVAALSRRPRRRARP